MGDIQGDEKIDDAISFLEKKGYKVKKGRLMGDPIAVIEG